MYNEGAPEYLVDQGLYYTSPTTYGYIGTGFEPTNNWEDYQVVFGHDGQDMQFIGAANESVPYLCYVPGYEYGQSPFNPYNPYIPGAAMGADGSFVTPSQYYALPSYESSAVLPAYQPVANQSRSNYTANGVADSFSDKGLSGSHANGQSAKYNFSSNTHHNSRAVADNSSTQRNTLPRAADGIRANNGSIKQPVPNHSSGSFPSQASTQARGAQIRENGSTGKASLGGYQLRTNLPSTTGASGFNSIDLSQSSINKVKPKAVHGRVLDELKAKPDPVSEQNQDPRTIREKNKIVVKAHSSMAGNVDAQGNITIFVDDYNSVEFSTDYKYAKFFVIKSYSEDDVHKSIKYNVWSSTPNGNKKLNAAYEGAQRVAAGDPKGCPIFLFFSVNASGQFCGVAEMTGPVDFNKDMDFWQQDKWSGCFPVKWHFVKDLPNPNFRHIILENNDNKPVTNSRDTTEIPYKKGLEMLRIYKYHMLKSSLLDDFMYYENRQRIMQEERARLRIKSYENPHIFPLLDPPRKLQPTLELPFVDGEKHVEDDSVNQNKINFAQGEKANSSVENLSVSLGKVKATQNMSSFALDEKERSSVKNTSVPLVRATSKSKTSGSGVDSGSTQVSADELKVSSLSIGPGKQESKSESSVPITSPSSKLNDESAGVVTIGSMPVKVKDINSTFLTVGTIQLDPKALQKK